MICIQYYIPNDHSTIGTFVWGVPLGKAVVRAPDGGVSSAPDVGSFLLDEVEDLGVKIGEVFDKTFWYFTMDPKLNGKPLKPRWFMVISSWRWFEVRSW